MTVVLSIAPWKQQLCTFCMYFSDFVKKIYHKCGPKVWEKCTTTSQLSQDATDMFLYETTVSPWIHRGYVPISTTIPKTKDSSECCILYLQIPGYQTKLWPSSATERSLMQRFSKRVPWCYGALWHTQTCAVWSHPGLLSWDLMLFHVISASQAEEGFVWLLCECKGDTNPVRLRSNDLMKVGRPQEKVDLLQLACNESYPLQHKLSCHFSSHTCVGKVATTSPNISIVGQEVYMVVRGFSHWSLQCPSPSWVQRSPVWKYVSNAFTLLTALSITTKRIFSLILKEAHRIQVWVM